ncbi:MAG: bifunctional DNA-formamidopyrimidine glycosylase/DNA-(apurinic or apyrimidinic site) lyase, partial [Hyphomonas sp.]
ARTVVFHLGMSGRWRIDPAAPDKHDHFVIETTDHRFALCDPRRFGWVDLVDTAALDTWPSFAAMGPEPLGPELTAAYLKGALEGRGQAIKLCLLDQRLVAGLGNIYVCEVLFRAGIHPARLARDLPPVQVAGLVPIIREVLAEAIEAGGSSLRDYRQADGELGYFQHTFRVYGREGQPCTTPGCTADVQRIVQSGRSSFFC